MKEAINPRLENAKQRRARRAKEFALEEAMEVVTQAWDRPRMLWVQSLLVRLAERILEGAHPGGNLLFGANVTIDAEEGEPELGWRTVEMKIKIVTPVRVTTCDKETK